MQFSILTVAAYATLIYGTPIDQSCSSYPQSTTLSNGHICTLTCGANRNGGDLSNSYTGTLSGCINSCGSNVNCATASYHEDNGYCYLKNTINSLNTGVSQTDNIDCCPGVFKSNGRVCTPSCQADRQGGASNATYTGDFDSCISACAADVSCKTAQFNLGNGYCYLKAEYHVLDPSTTTSTVDCCPDVKTINGRTCTTTCLADRAGGNYASLYTATLEGCIEACGEDSNCQTAQYHIDTQTCYLKDSVNALDSSLTTDTIDCV